MRKYSFEAEPVLTQGCATIDRWWRCGRTFDTAEEAGAALGEWLAVCFINGATVSGRIVEVVEE